MSYDSLSKNKKLLDNLYKRKIFKTNIFHKNNKDGYEWDDYDTTHYYPETESDPLHILVNCYKKHIFITKDYVKYYFQEGDKYKHIIIAKL